ncbi:methyl-accepting chemotaxis protein [Crenobacter sp. SG2305]|uniref:methyl-accepting chemotaxis protein n=1 Tax=Crenobacter oryzisoli TaxID=3056844 RepID=UPI0025AACF3E|nr:methyl-accepting chemotaxis protein [Crenobacter sp. SG2305]MDN0083358.1 methyl-accepting chemotaxis protein [Crenobacter sp. SG2305]
MDQQKQWGHLRTKIVLVAAAAVFVGFAVMVGLIVKMSYSRTEQAGYQLARQQADGYARQVQNKLDTTLQLPRHLAQAVLAQKAGGKVDRAVVDKQLLGLLNDSPGITGLWMLWEPNAFDGNDNTYRFDWPKQDPTGRYTPYITRGKDGKATIDIMMSSDRVKDFPKYKDHPESYQPDYEKPGWGDYYYTPKQRQRDTITEPFPYEVNGQKELESSLVYAIKDAGGRFLGVAAADLLLGDLQKELGSQHPYDTGYIQLVSEGGLFVVNPDTQKLGKPVEHDGELARALAKTRQGDELTFESDGFTHFLHPIKVADTGQVWTLGVSVPTAAITAPAVALRNTAIAIGVVALLAILAVLYAVVSYLIRPLTTLAETMETLASGQGDLTARIEVANRDEIGRTADAFNRFIASLREMFIEVRSQSQAVSRSATQLAASAEAVQSSSRQQSEAASATAAGVEQVTVSVQHIADTAQQAEAMARQTGELTEGSVSTVARVSADIAHVTQTMHALSERMTGLGQRSEEVSSILKVIKDIADQTNLLALNAAIEAARAGEQGRGFAVVADEVRQLAARTSEATLDIGRIVTAIRTETREAVDEVERTRGLVVESVDVTEAADQSMRQVSERTDELMTRMIDIAASTREQSAASIDIAQNVERISTMAQANSEVIGEVAESVSQLRELSDRLEGLVGSFRL